MTGLSSAGKTTIGALVAQRLLRLGHAVEQIDGDIFRSTLGRGLGFSPEDRNENVRRMAIVATLLARHGVVVIVSAISPYRHARALVRVGALRFIEVFVDAPVAVCEQRDGHGVYRRFRAGEIAKVSGMDDPYEPPEDPEVHCRTDIEHPEQSADKVASAFLGKVWPGVASARH